MNCRDFTNEFEERNALGETAALHLNDCADCRKMSAAQTRVWQAIETFEKADAPKDFNFRVKAKIADTKSDDFTPRLFPVLRYVLGLSIVGLILTFVIFKGVYSLDEKTVPQVAKDNFQAPIQKTNPPAQSAAPEQIASAPVPQSPPDKNLIAVVSKPKTAPVENKKESKIVESETRLVAVNSVKMPQVKNSTDNGEKNFDNSHINASSDPTVLTPKGILGQSQKGEKPSNFDGASSITAEQILSQLGIETALENGKRQVKKISANSVGERSGVRVGDVIEAIDGEKLTSEPIRAKTIEGKNLTVIRGAEKIEISLHN